MFVGRNVTERCNELITKYGTIMKLHMGPKEFILLSDPDLIKNVFTNSKLADHYKDVGPLQYSLPGFISLSNYNDHTILKRRIMTRETFSSHQFGLEVLVDECRQMFDAFKDVQVLDLDDLLAHLLSNIIFAVVSGSRLPCKYGDVSQNTYMPGDMCNYLLQIKSVIHNGSNWLHCFSGTFPFIGWLLERHMKYTKVKILEIKKGLVDMFKRGNGGAYHKYLSCVKNGDFDQETCDYMAVEHCAGTFTQSIYNMQVFMHEIIRNKRIQQKLHKELDGIMKPGVMPNIKDMPYLYACIKESYRFGGISLNVRVTTEDVNLGKYTLAKGTSIFPYIYGVYRSPKYFENPDSFIPERFLDTDNGTYDPLNPRTSNYTFMPFGSGLRICPGMKFGHELVCYVAAYMAYMFDLSYTDGTEAVKFSKRHVVI
jgi:cytochrome P450